MHKLLKNRALIHSAFWISYFILITWFYSDIGGFNFALQKSSILIAIQAFIFYINLFVLLPRFFENKRYVLYGLIITIILVNLLLVLSLTDRYFLSGFMRQIPYFDNAPEELKEIIKGRSKHILDSKFGPFILMSRRTLINGFSLISMLFISTIYRNISLNIKRDQEAIILKNQMLEAETTMLKWQINPHFLFNTLNNIYALAQLKSDKAPDAIHRLSKMLSYVIYDCNEKHVELGKEVEYIKSYIELQLLKDEDIRYVNYDLEEINSSLQIAPLLFITFIENSFKHCNICDVENGWIKIILKTSGNICNFRVSNSYSENSVYKDKTKGIGLDNVKRRLKLIYPDRHELTVKKDEKSFSIDLKITLT